MPRLLRLAEFLFGAGVRRDVFEPMLADRARELADAAPATFRLRVRWAMAIARAFLASTPNALAVRMPTLLLLDVIGCAITFPFIAFILQWPDVRPAGTGRLGLDSVLVASLAFTVIPIVWRFRVAAVAEHHSRALARTFVLLLSAIVVSLGVGDWPARAAHVLSIMWLAVAGWRLGDPNRPQYFTAVPLFIVRFAMVAACLNAASWPLKLALGIDLFTPYWPRQEVSVYVIAWFTVLTLKKRFNGFTSIGP